MIRAALVAFTLWAGMAQGACRQALALGMDVSGSVDAAEYALQFQGLAAALESPEVLDSLLTLPDAPVSLMIYEWSGPSYQRVIAPWVTIQTQADVSVLTAILRAQVRTEVSPTTGIGTAIGYGISQLNQKSDCWALTLDISGDGKNNSGPEPGTANSAAQRGRVTINGLVIGVDTPARISHEELEVGELTAYYRRHVLAGPNAFLEVALGFADFERAMQKKLLRELEFQALSLLHQ